VVVGFVLKGLGEELEGCCSDFITTYRQRATHTHTHTHTQKDTQFQKSIKKKETRL